MPGKVQNVKQHFYVRLGHLSYTSHIREVYHTIVSAVGPSFAAEECLM